jgi:hypothetical protein
LRVKYLFASILDVLGYHLSLRAVLKQLCHFSFSGGEGNPVYGSCELSLDKQVSVVSGGNGAVSVERDVDGVVHPGGWVGKQRLEVVEVLQQFDGLILDDIPVALLQLSASHYLVYIFLNFLRVLGQGLADLLE